MLTSARCKYSEECLLFKRQDVNVWKTVALCSVYKVGNTCMALHFVIISETTRRAERCVWYNMRFVLYDFLSKPLRLHLVVDLRLRCPHQSLKLCGLSKRKRMLVELHACRQTDGAVSMITWQGCSRPEK
jgi:hypothetical protein